MVLSTYVIFERATPVFDIPIVEYQYSYPCFIASSSCNTCLRTYFSFLNGVRRGLGRAVTDTLCRNGRVGLPIRLIHWRRTTSFCSSRQPCGKLDHSKQEL